MNCLVVIWRCTQNPVGEEGGREREKRAEEEGTGEPASVNSLAQCSDIYMIG